ncbi:glycosyltransferase family 2 protein [Paenibacillus hexagrammi]|uniref:Glycosyltransferase n=1 Tax=Paenibacillus hexagrammi TaxID=2908839 RepID=A0ABY3SJP6_9BACL|nr:glycosyltransferase family 2 protein [Paenibacillus sp. YPD9-1]UJF33207.1 glycosyltransferase [Paenibacillus sp. YPD9-1]
MKSPFISVIMPVYNGESFVAEAVESVLSQTFTDFEMIIINDASTDRTADILEAYQDPRIVVVHNKANLRVASSLNKGILLAKGTYIVRMDADDRCMPERFAKQVAFMERNPDCAVCSSSVRIMGSNRIVSFPMNHEEISSHLVFYCCIAHPTVMLRKEAIFEFSLLYSANMKEAEDYELWTRASRLVDMHVLEEPLLEYRLHPNQATVRGFQEMNRLVDQIRKQQLLRLDVVPTDDEYRVHRLVCDGAAAVYQSTTPAVTADYSAVQQWIKHLIERNRMKKVFDLSSFEDFLLAYSQRAKIAHERLDKLKEVSSSRVVWIWGTGANAGVTLETLQKYGVDIGGFIDNNSTKWGTLFEGLPVVEPTKVTSNAYVLICSMYSREISKQLNDMGFEVHTDFLPEI